ncbi:MAG: Hsp70 family protein [Bacteroidia bacterium]|nr:Hsp70 family protein [Bacteroidia bacterium]
MASEIIVGIDLGTTYSVVSTLAENKPVTLTVDGNKLLPSVVSYSNGGFIVGQTARNMAILEPENTIRSIKRKMGQDITIPIGNKNMRPEEVSSLILKKIKDSTQEQLGLGNDKLRAVVTVPAYFTEVQREATKQAAEFAGIIVERIINEPTAAALSFGLTKLESAKYAVYDLGGGTFDISIVENNTGIIEVLATKGDNFLGGDDFDELLADFIWKRFTQANNIEAERNSKINARLLKIAEESKIKLSFEYSIDIKENFFLKLNDKSYHLEVSVSRNELEELINPHIEKTLDLIEQAIAESGLSLESLTGILLVGGSSRIPVIHRLIEDKFNIVPILIENPDEAVSHGATIQGAIINQIDIDTVLVDITPHSLGIETLDPFNFQDFYNGGGEDEGLFHSVIIPRNTAIPVKRTQHFSAVTEYQEGYDIKIYQGENIKVKYNKLVGKVHFKVKKPVEYGTLDVTFELDINGILKMSAVQNENGESVEAVFQSSRGMKISNDKITEKIHSLDESAQTLINRVNKLLSENKITGEDKFELEDLLKKYKEQKAGKISEANDTETRILDLLYYLEEN